MIVRRTASRRTSAVTKLTVAALGLLALSFVPGSAAGDEPPGGAKPPATRPATRPAGDRPGPERPRPKAKPLTGKVAKVEDGSLHLFVGDAGREVIVPVEPDTEVLVAGEKAKLEDLQREWTVSVTQEKGLTRTIDAKPPKVRPGPKVPDKAGGKARGDARPAA